MKAKDSTKLSLASPLFLLFLILLTFTETNENEFNIISKELRIRSEGKLDDSYTFTKEGIALSNNALAISTYKYPILLNPFENIDSIYKIQYLLPLIVPLM